MKRFEFLVGMMGLGLVGYSAERLTVVKISSKSYYTLASVSKNLGCSFSQSGKNLFLKKTGTVFKMTEERREASFNGTSVPLAFAPIRDGNQTYISTIDYEYLLHLLVVEHYSPKKALRIMLDPGHGGKDPGCMSADKKSKESQIVLSVAKQLAENLKIWGFTVQLTRTRDVFLTLEERSELAKKWKADLFISLHINAVSGVNSNVSGIETHLLPPYLAPATNTSNPLKSKVTGHNYAKSNLMFAYDMQQNVLAATKAEDRSVRYSTFSVLRNAPCPAVLLEMGFMSHPSELKNLNSLTYQRLLVAGIIGGVRSYQKRS